MKMERLDAQSPSPEELKELEKLRVLIERAVDDGRITKVEMEAIKAAIAADGKVTFEELDLCQKLIWEKIRIGELEFSW